MSSIAGCASGGGDLAMWGIRIPAQEGSGSVSCTRGKPRTPLDRGLVVRCRFPVRPVSGRDRPAPPAQPVNGVAVRSLRLPDFDRVHQRGSFWGNPKTRSFAKLLIDCEEHRTLRAVFVGMLAEMERQ